MATTDPFLAALGARVRALRTVASLTQAGLAARAGLSAKYVSEIETGSVNPSVGVIHVLARDGLGVPLAALFNFALARDEAEQLAREITALVVGLGEEDRRRALQALRAFFVRYPELDRPAATVPRAAEEEAELRRRGAPPGRTRQTRPPHGTRRP